jgi:hypothetical protein
VNETSSSVISAEFLGNASRGIAVGKVAHGEALSVLVMEKKLHKGHRRPDIASKNLLNLILFTCLRTNWFAVHVRYTLNAPKGINETLLQDNARTEKWFLAAFGGIGSYAGADDTREIIPSDAWVGRSVGGFSLRF